MPAHDWTVVTLTQYSSPATQIVVAEHRNDSAAVGDANSGDGHKGTSGFWPSQPCGNLNPNLALPSPTSATKGNASSSASGYTVFTADFLTKAYAASNAAGPLGSKAQGNFFKSYDALRVSWDRHSSNSGGNYSFADGHAKYQNLGATVNPASYEYGDHWYPVPAAWGTACQ
jgi:prepilin-type processing-associated H-X9-DG protein